MNCSKMIRPLLKKRPLFRKATFDRSKNRSKYLLNFRAKASRSSSGLGWCWDHSSENLGSGHFWESLERQRLPKISFGNSTDADFLIVKNAIFWINRNIFRRNEWKFRIFYRHATILFRNSKNGQKYLLNLRFRISHWFLSFSVMLRPPSLIWYAWMRS